MFPRHPRFSFLASRPVRRNHRLTTQKWNWGDIDPAPPILRLAFIYCKARERCEEALAALDAGKPFEEVAKEYSEGPNAV